jgi:3-hydroxy-9,10-secoandrosta-1,3,5(10)-triene-9,17-dione monooxygenase
LRISRGRAVPRLAAEAAKRLNVRDGSRAVEDPFMQHRLAEAAAEIKAARDRMLANFAEMMRRAHAGEEISLSDRTRYRRDSGKAIDRSVYAVDRLFESAGGHALFLDNPIWRDVHAMRARAGNNPERASFIFARSEFGLPPQDIRF